MPFEALRGWSRCESGARRSRATMRCVYLLRSLRDPARRYVGSTGDLERRFADHNAGCSPHTAKYSPWDLLVAIHFADNAKAEAFERYLKQGSGHASAKRHFW